MHEKSADYQKVWYLLQELIEAGKETDRRISESDQQLKEQMKKTDKKLEKTLKGIDGLKKYVGGIANSNGYVTEGKYSVNTCVTISQLIHYESKMFLKFLFKGQRKISFFGIFVL